MIDFFKLLMTNNNYFHINFYFKLNFSSIDYSVQQLNYRYYSNKLYLYIIFRFLTEVDLKYEVRKECG